MLALAMNVRDDQRNAVEIMVKTLFRQWAHGTSHYTVDDGQVVVFMDLDVEEFDRPDADWEQFAVDMENGGLIESFQWDAD